MDNCFIDMPLNAHSPFRIFIDNSPLPNFASTLTSGCSCHPQNILHRMSAWCLKRFLFIAFPIYYPDKRDLMSRHQYLSESSITQVPFFCQGKCDLGQRQSKVHPRDCSNTNFTNDCIGITKNKAQNAEYDKKHNRLNYSVTIHRKYCRANPNQWEGPIHETFRNNPLHNPTCHTTQ